MSCSRCRRDLSPEAFYRKRGDKRQAYCKDCCREYARNRRLLTYGLTQETYDELRTAQLDACAICRQRVSLHIDHDHVTGAVRGLLCSTCNTGLGMFRDDPVALRRAALYLTGDTTMARDEYVAALLAERDGYARQGRADRVRDVDDHLAALGLGSDGKAVKVQETAAAPKARKA